MSEEYGPDYITVTDEEGGQFELELVDSLEHGGVTYHAFLPASGPGEETGETREADADDEEYGLIILKEAEENGEAILSTPDTDEELETVYQLFMDLFFADEKG